MVKTPLPKSIYVDCAGSVTQTLPASASPSRGSLPRNDMNHKQQATAQQTKRHKELFKELGLEDSNSCSNMSPTRSVAPSTSGASTSSALGLDISSSSDSESDSDRENDKARAYIQRRKPPRLSMSNNLGCSTTKK